MSRQAYLFAHRALCQELFANPPRILAILQGPDGGRYLGDLWRHCGRFVAPGTATEPPPLQPEVARIGDRLVTHVRMPPPREPTEAHAVVLVAGLRPDAVDLSGLTTCRYYTLEHAIDIHRDAPMTMLCEWTVEGVHRNHGAGPPADGPTRALIERALALYEREAGAPGDA
ncbi:MAG: hypothetical protein R3B09_33710 [Nannocystaceae bacterium]